MNSYDFTVACKNEIIKYYREHYNKVLKISKIDVIWSCESLDSYKAILVADSNYKEPFECTYNRTTRELGFDIYEKIIHKTFKNINTLVINESVAKENVK